MDLQNIQEQINKLGADMSELLIGESMTPEQENRFEKMDGDRDRLLKQRDRIIKHQSIENKLSEAGERRTESTNPASAESRSVTRGSAAKATDQADALRGWLLAGSNQVPSDEQRSAGQRLGMDINRREFTFKLAVNPNEVRAQAVGTGAAGGFTVPDEPMRALEVALLNFGGMRSAASVIRTSTGAALPIPTVNDTNQVGVILAENAVVANQDVVFAQLVLDAYKYSSKQVLVSLELLQDNSINIGQFLGNALANRIGRILNTHFTVGTGTAQPNGVVTAAFLGKAGATGQTTSVIYNDLVDLFHSVDVAYRNNASWMMNDLTLAAIKKIKIAQFSGDTSGQPLWQPALALGAPDTILGKAIVVNNDVPVMAASAKSILFGDFSKYLIRDVRDITLVRLDERYADAGQVGFLAFSRHDGDLLDAGTHPIKFYQNSAT